MIFLGSLEDCTDPLLELPIVCSLPSTTHDILPLTYQQIPFQLNPLFPNADLSVLRLENPTVSAAPAPCKNCTTEIYDKTFLLIGQDSFHERCVKCSVCQQSLSDHTSCFFRDNQMFCRADFLSKYKKKCQRCLNGIDFGDYYYSVQEILYHVDCFLCHLCNRHLNIGDRCILADNGVVYCDMHFEHCLNPSVLFEKMSPEQSSTESPKSQRQKGRKCQNEVVYYDDAGDKEEPNHAGNRKSKRMRTSFKHHQLKTMKTYFNLNHNPDAKDLKQLAQKTGLTKRVLQVWFQNARAKYRRGQHGTDTGSVSTGYSNIYQDNSFGESVRTSSSSPSRLESTCSMSPDETSENSRTNTPK